MCILSIAGPIFIRVPPYFLLCLPVLLCIMLMICVVFNYGDMHSRHIANNQMISNVLYLFYYFYQ